jgi:hypothetical protein
MTRPPWDRLPPEHRRQIISLGIVFLCLWAMIIIRFMQKDVPHEPQRSNSQVSP